MTAIFKQHGETFSFIPPSHGLEHSKLPAGIYSITIDKEGVRFSLVSKSFNIPEKIYGTKTSKYSSWFKAQLDIKPNLGAMFVGTSGSGKSVDAEFIINKMVSVEGLPVLLIDKSYSGATLSNISDIVGDAVFYFREFDKNYTQADCLEADTSRNGNGGPLSYTTLLEFLSGASAKRRISMFTANNSDHDFIKNRPGRAYFWFKYGVAEVDAREEYVTSKVIPTELKDYLLGVFKNASIDSYYRFVDEVADRYDDYAGLSDLELTENIMGDLASINLGLEGEEISILTIRGDKETKIDYDSQSHTLKFTTTFEGGETVKRFKLYDGEKIFDDIVMDTRYSRFIKQVIGEPCTSLLLPPTSIIKASNGTFVFNCLLNKEPSKMMEFLDKHVSIDSTEFM